MTFSKRAAKARVCAPYPSFYDGGKRASASDTDIYRSKAQTPPDTPKHPQTHPNNPKHMIDDDDDGGDDDDDDNDDAGDDDD